MAAGEQRGFWLGRRVRKAGFARVASNWTNVTGPHSPKRPPGRHAHHFLTFAVTNLRRTGENAEVWLLHALRYDRRCAHLFAGSLLLENDG